MKMRNILRGLLWGAASIALQAGTASARPDAKVDMTFDHFYDGPAVEAALRELHAAYPDLTKLESIGKSEEGRDLWLLSINNPGTGKDTDKPGIYVDGSIHGNEIQATEVCLYLAWYLLDGYGRIPKITEVVDRCAFYIIPVVNVDGRWRFFAEASGYNIGRTAIVPHDDDRDGLLDEDPYEDLDGDGEILEMRVRDPFGGYKSHPDDPRVMVRVKPGEKGEWEMLGTEGIDNDEDGKLNEDPAGYLDMNRNYGFKWQPAYVQSGAGDYPMSGMVTRAVSQFILTKPNICFSYAFHNSGGLILRGPGSKLAGNYPPSDVKVFDFLGQEGEKIIPGYKYAVSKDELYTTHGDFDEWMYSSLGIYGFVGELFMSSQEQYRKPGEKGPDGDQDDSWYGGTRAEEKQKFNDIVNQGEMFRDWKPFVHPQFGNVEIGGWRTFTTRIPPAFMLPEMVHRNASLVIFTAQHAPEVALEVLEVKELAPGLHRVRVRASNMRAIPSLSSRAVQKKLAREDMLQLAGRGLTVVGGATVDDLRLDQISPVEHRPERIFLAVPGFGKQDVQWIVRGKGRATVTFRSLRARDQSLSFDL